MIKLPEKIPKISLWLNLLSSSSHTEWYSDYSAWIDRHSKPLHSAHATI